jgi:amidase
MASQIPDLVLMDATTLARVIRSRKASCVEVMTTYLDHIEAINPKVNAIVALQERAGLLTQARECDNQLARGEPVGPLHGFPQAVKDLEWVKGIRSTSGSPILKDFIPKDESTMVARLRMAGAIFIGKTNTPEFGLGSHTFNPVYGPTLNAYDQAYSAGGSSGGAGVSLALRMLPVADGSDYGGSLRNPAGWNNVFGFRPSIGRVPSDGFDVWLPSIGVKGPMARTVTDLAMLLSVQAGFDPASPLSLEGDGSLFRQRLGQDMKGKRIAWGGDFNGHTPCEPEVLDVAKTAAQSFESLGCHVEDAVPDFDYDALWRSIITLRAWQSGFGLSAFYDDVSKRALLKPEAVYEVETGRKLSAFEVSAASIVRTQWTEAVRRFFQRYDYLVVPTSQVFPFPVGLHWPKEINGRKMSTYHEWFKAALLVSVSGSAALAVPAGFGHEGLPIGIQIIAPAHREMDCLQLAHAYEQANPWIAARLPPLLLPP